MSSYQQSLFSTPLQSTFFHHPCSELTHNDVTYTNEKEALFTEQLENKINPKLDMLCKMKRLMGCSNPKRKQLITSCPDTELSSQFFTLIGFTLWSMKPQ